MLDAALNEIIGGIYDAAIEPRLWHDAIDRLRTHFAFHIAMLTILKLPESTTLIQVACNVPAPFLESAARYSPYIPELWGGAAAMMRLPSEEPILHSRVPGFERRDGNPFNEYWGKPQGLVDQVVIGFGHELGMFANIGLGLHKDRAPFTDAELDDLRLIAPHLSRAVTISRVLDLAIGTTSTFRAAFDAISAGALLVSSDLAILNANRAAEQMLRFADPIRATEGRLGLIHELVPGQLAGAVAQAANEALLGRRGIGLPARRRDGTPVTLHVMPLERRSSRAGIDAGATAAVFVADGAPQADFGSGAVALLYGLTPAESRVFALVAKGRSSKAIAAELGIAPSTVRTHLLRVFDKTDRHNRAGLVGLANEVKLPV